MDDTWLLTPEGGWVLMARTICCPYCPEETGVLTIPIEWSAREALDWYSEVHLAVHVEALIDSAREFCARCQRYAVSEPVIPPTDRLHRRCFAAVCDCLCSQVTTLAPVFKEPAC